MNIIENFLQIFIIRQTVFLRNMLKKIQFVSRFFQFRRNDIFLFAICTSKRNQRWRHIDILETSTHRIFSANCSEFQIHLCIVSSKKRSQWFSPFFRFISQFFEIFLETQTDILIFSSHCHNFSNALYDRICSSNHRVLRRNFRIKTPTCQRNSFNIFRV